MKLDSSSQNLDSLIEQYNRELMRFYQQNAPRSQPDGEPFEEPEGPVRVAYPAAIVPPPNPTESQENSRQEMEQESFGDTVLSAQPSPVSKSFPIHLESEGQAEGTLPGVPTVDEPETARPRTIRVPMSEADSEMPVRRDSFPQAATQAPSAEEAVPSEEPSLPMSIGYLQVFLSSAREATPIPDAIVTITRVNGGGEELYAHTTTDADGLTEVLALPAVDSTLTLEPGIPSPYTSYNIQATAPGYFRVLNVNAPIYGGNTAVQPVQMIPIPEFELSPQDLVFFQTGPQDL